MRWVRIECASFSSSNLLSWRALFERFDRRQFSTTLFRWAQSSIRAVRIAIKISCRVEIKFERSAFHLRFMSLTFLSAHIFCPFILFHSVVLIFAKCHSNVPIASSFLSWIGCEVSAGCCISLLSFTHRAECTNRASKSTVMITKSAWFFSLRCSVRTLCRCSFLILSIDSDVSA